MNPALLNDLQALLQQAKPSSLVIVDNHGSAKDLDLPADAKPFLLQQPSHWRALDDVERCELAVVLGDFEQCETREAITLLGRLRDLYSKRLLCAFSRHGSLSKNDCIALGMSELHRFDSPDWSLYEFNIHSYKHVPDWLNSRFWANPEMWDKHRW